MRTIAVVAAAGFLAFAGVALGETAAPERENGRYTFKDVADGLLRLDTRTALQQARHRLGLPDLAR